jgi:hypothetical protein
VRLLSGVPVSAVPSASNLNVTDVRPFSFRAAKSRRARAGFVLARADVVMSAGRSSRRRVERVECHGGSWEKREGGRKH